MNIAFIGPGILPIPPNGWGAVELLVWEYAKELGELGHTGTIINTPDHDQIIDELKNDEYDFIHLHYDMFYSILDRVSKVQPKAKIAISSHHAYIERPEIHTMYGYAPVFEFLKNNKKYYNFCISEKDYNAFLSAGADPEFLRICKNGANHNEINFNTDCLIPDRSIYLAKIELRKRQYIYQTINSIDFVGHFTSSTPFEKNHPRYLGEWEHDYKMNHLTDYANLILLSDGENGSPLVIKEAFMAGLGVVVSKWASHELDPSLPFVTIIDDDKWEDLDYVENKIKENRDISVTMRDKIREYGVENWSWEKLVRIYEKNVKDLL
jgi:glycosyltransferase involved in cell wall biosynthesis